MKLQFKVTILVIIILVVIGILSGGMLLYFQRGANVRQFENMAEALAGAVQSSLEHSMLISDLEMTQQVLLNISEREILHEVDLYSPSGAITASSEISNIGKVTNRNEIHQVLQSYEAYIWTKQQVDTGELLVVTPILNKVKCQTCHDSENIIL